MLRAETEKQQSRKKQFDGGDDDECDDDEIMKIEILVGKISKTIFW